MASVYRDVDNLVGARLADLTFGSAKIQTRRKIPKKSLIFAKKKFTQTKAKKRESQ
jgi:hypothetical protein